MNMAVWNKYFESKLTYIVTSCTIPYLHTCLLIFLPSPYYSIILSNMYQDIISVWSNILHCLKLWRWFVSPSLLFCFITIFRKRKTTSCRGRSDESCAGVTNDSGQSESRAEEAKVMDDSRYLGSTLHTSRN